IATWFGQGADAPDFLQDIALLLGPGQPLHVLLFAVLIIFFCFFYTALMFNPREFADNLKKGGVYLPGIRPGVQSSKYIDSAVPKRTFDCCMYISDVYLMQ